MSSSETRWQHLRAEFADLGPLRPVAVATAVLPTAGLMLGLGNPRELAAAGPAAPLGHAAA
ncbi:MAG: hypothetical protein ACK57Q_16705, partial [Planctomycetota bacterium]